MDLGLEDKVALVLASSKGLGFACAKGFYDEGAHVMLCSRSKENLESATNLIRTNGRQNELAFYVTDLAEKGAIKELIENTLKTFGRIDILVHNAGGPPSAPISRITEDDWENSIKLNLMSFIWISKHVIPVMQKQRHGRIIAITSVSVKQPLENLVLSNTTRMGVVGSAKTLANEYAKDNILVNVVCPGPTLTGRMQEIIDTNVRDTGKTEEEIKKAWTDQIPMGRMGAPEELANLVVFLGSARASYITGTTIQVDGGFVKGPF